PAPARWGGVIVCLRYVTAGGAGCWADIVATAPVAPAGADSLAAVDTQVPAVGTHPPADSPAGAESPVLVGSPVVACPGTSTLDRLQRDAETDIGRDRRGRLARPGQPPDRHRRAAPAPHRQSRR